MAPSSLSRSAFCAQLCLALGAGSAFARATDAPENDPIPVPLGRSDDTYEILSLLIATLETTKNEYLVPDTTDDLDGYFGTGRPVTSQKGWFAVGGGSIVEGPEDLLPRFNEGLADIAACKGQRLRLEPRFTLPPPYRMMNSGARAENQERTPPAVVQDPIHTWRLDPGSLGSTKAGSQ